MRAFRYRIVSWVILALVIAASPAAALSPEELFDRFRTVVENIGAYQCRVSAWSLYDGELETRIVNVYYKQPRQVRTDILIGSRRGDDDSVAVLLPNGRVRVKSSSVFMPFPLTFDLEHHRVTTIRGQTITDSTLQGILELFEERLKVSDASVEERDDSYVLELRLRRPQDYKGVTEERLSFDKETLLPRKNDTYEGSTHVQHVVWSDYIINTDLPDELFGVRFDPVELTEQGIDTVAIVAISDDQVKASRTE